MSRTTSYTLDRFQRLTFIGHVPHFLSSHANRSIFPSKSAWRRDFHETEEVVAFWNTVGMIASRSLRKRATITGTSKIQNVPQYSSLFSYHLFMLQSYSFRHRYSMYLYALPLFIATKLEYTVMQQRGFLGSPANGPSFCGGVQWLKTTNLGQRCEEKKDPFAIQVTGNPQCRNHNF